MKSPESIEAALARLIPVSVSDSSQRSLDAMIDTLAATTPRRPRMAPRILAAAAAVVIGLASWLIWPSGHVNPVAQAAPVPSGLEVITSSEHIETVRDEGLMQDAGGKALRAMRLRIVEKNQFRDAKTGEVVVVSAPREELVYYPVSSF